jgi:hypothetical protein
MIEGYPDPGGPKTWGSGVESGVGSGSARSLQIIEFLRHYQHYTYRTVVKRVGAVGDLDLNVVYRNVILRRGHVLHASAYLAHFPSLSRRRNFRQRFLLDLFVVRGYAEHCSCANSEKIQIKGGQCYFLIYRLFLIADLLLVRAIRNKHRLNMALDHQSLFGLHVYSCTHWLRPHNHPSPRIWAHIRGCC